MLCNPAHALFPLLALAATCRSAKTTPNVTQVPAILRDGRREYNLNSTNFNNIYLCGPNITVDIGGAGRDGSFYSVVYETFSGPLLKEISGGLRIANFTVPRQNETHGVYTFMPNRTDVGVGLGIIDRRYQDTKDWLYNSQVWGWYNYTCPSTRH